jgi:acetyl-CoA acetyltransferase
LREARAEIGTDIDGIATAGETPVTVAHYLGLTPKWVDGTAVGGCSFMIHVRHAAAAIESGLCKTVLITHGESGRSGIGRTRNVAAPTSLAGQFEQPYGPMGPATLFTIPVLRYMKTYGLAHEQLAVVSVVQREWAAKDPRATFKAPITVEDVLNSRMIAYPFRPFQCCLVTDGGAAPILVAAERGYGDSLLILPVSTGAALCETELITSGESGRSRVGRTAMSQHRPASPARAALWTNGAADSGRDSGAALHEDPWRQPRAMGDGLGRAARMGDEEPALDRQDASASRASRGRLARALGDDLEVGRSRGIGLAAALFPILQGR